MSGDYVAPSTIFLPSQPKHRRQSMSYYTTNPDKGGRSQTEPSLMMPGIIISLIFNEQGKLVLRATPLQN
jgi:hypothetical protein